MVELAIMLDRGSGGCKAMGFDFPRSHQLPVSRMVCYIWCPSKGVRRFEMRTFMVLALVLSVVKCSGNKPEPTDTTAPADAAVVTEVAAEAVVEAEPEAAAPADTEMVPETTPPPADAPADAPPAE